MKATFIGDPSQPKGVETVPETMTMFGLEFNKGEAVEIPKALQDKFRNHSHFKVVEAK